MSELQNKLQELADNLGFDLKKLPYGYKFKLEKISADFYHTTGTLVICQPKKNQIVKKKVDIDDLKDMLMKLSKKEECEMSELISGKEALHAIADQKDVEYLYGDQWLSCVGEQVLITAFTGDKFKFRLKPRTIMIGDVEVPDCGKNYKFGEPMYVLNSLDPDEYSRVILDDQDDIPLYWWRTESEIKQVVAALRKLFEG